MLMIALVAVIPIEGSNQTTPLILTKLSTQATNLGNGCYFPILIKINATWTDPTTIETISLSSFWLVVTMRNLVVGNSTAASYKNPDNTLQSVNLFPNIPTILALSFTKTCITSLNTVELFYADGVYNYTWALP